MENLHIHIEISSKLYKKNPASSDLGQKIISKSIEMINQLGFECFTFGKLGKKIDSNESSIYRYFDSKHALLVYLTSWYWTWIEYKVVFATNNIQSLEDRLNIALDFLTKPVEVDTDILHVNEVLLSEIIFSESLKAYHTTQVDAENKKGCFNAYKHVVKRVSDIVTEINPQFSYPHMLISTVIEGAHQQKHFAEHLPSLTDVPNDNAISTFYREMVFKLIK